MKRILILGLLAVLSIGVVMANEIAVKKNDKKIGSIEYTYSIQTFETREGCFVTITLTNTTLEFVNVGFTTDAGGFENVHLRPGEKNVEVVIGCNKVATKAFPLSEYVYVK